MNTIQIDYKGYALDGVFHVNKWQVTVRKTRIDQALPPEDRCLVQEPSQAEAFAEAKRRVDALFA